MPARILQATPSGYLVQLEDGTTTQIPEHVAVQAGLIQPTAGSQQQPDQYAAPTVPLLGGANAQVAASPDRAHGVYEGRYAPRTPEQHTGASQLIDRNNGVQEARYMPPARPVGDTAGMDPRMADRANGVYEGHYAPGPNVPVHVDATEDLERASRKAKHIAQLRAMLGLE